MNVVLFLLLLFQNSDYAPAANAVSEPVRRESQLRDASALHSPESNEGPRTVYAAARNEEFVEKFNNLIVKLVAFADEYRNKQAIDVKKAREIRKAWLELQKVEALFREDPGK